MWDGCSAKLSTVGREAPYYSPHASFAFLAYWAKASTVFGPRGRMLRASFERQTVGIDWQTNESHRRASLRHPESSKSSLRLRIGGLAREGRYR